MSTTEFHPAVELLTSSNGGSIHIIRFLDQDFFKEFSDTYLLRPVKSKQSSLEFCYLNSSEGKEEVLLINLDPVELHIHGGPANLQHLQNLLQTIPYTKINPSQLVAETWQACFRSAKAEKCIEYLLSIRSKALANDQTLLNDSSDYDIEGYDYLNPINVLLVGPPNAGKSTLFNYLVGEQRALISDIEGTTRDTLSARLTFGGHEVNLFDTAGLRDHVLEKGVLENDDSIQSQSEKLVLSIAQNCDLFCLFNSPEPPSWIPVEKIIHLKSKSELNLPAHPNALPFSIHQNSGCRELLEYLTEVVTKQKKGSVSTHFFYQKNGG